MKNVFYALALTALMTACSSKFDPDVAFKGEIDENFLTTLSRGEIPVTLVQDCSKSYIFTKPYVDGQGVGDWEEWNGEGWSVSNHNIYVFNGCSWDVYSHLPFLDADRILLESWITNAWWDYEDKTGYNKRHFIKCPFEFDIKNKKVLIGELWNNIESANNDILVLSHDGYGYGATETSSFGIRSLVKHIYTYYSKPQTIFDPENDETYETIKDVVLARLRLMIEYFGDVWTETAVDGIYELKLAKIEELLLAGKNKWEDLTDEEKDEIYPFRSLSN